MRGLVALLLIAALVGAAAFFADHPGRVEIVWQDWQIETSVGALIAAAVLGLLLVWAIFAGLRALWRTPRWLRRMLAERRQLVGRRALTRGLIALAAGEGAEAEQQARRADRLLADEPAALVLTAQAAQLNNDGPAARRAFTAMLDRPDLAFVGLRGLLAEAMQAGDHAAALRLAEQARLLRPKSAWLAETLIALETRSGNWQEAAATLADGERRGLLPKERARHQRGAILYELSRAAEIAGDARRAAALAAKAQALRPDLPATACQHARLLLGLGKTRAAAKIIERAWRLAPHPELAAGYAAVHAAAPPLARASAFQRLAAENPPSPESDLAIAEAALTAQLWGEARRHLNRAAAILGSPRRLCLTMARLEEAEHGNVAAARHWLGRAAAAAPDGSYICSRCNGECAEWHALCLHCGGFDTLAWREPGVAPKPPAPAPPTALPAPGG